MQDVKNLIENGEAGDVLEIEVVEMEEKDYYNLPEFQ